MPGFKTVIQVNKNEKKEKRNSPVTKQDHLNDDSELQCSKELGTLRVGWHMSLSQTKAEEML